MNKRIISVAIIIMAIGTILFSEKEEGRVMVNIAEANTNLGQEINQALEEVRRDLVIMKDGQSIEKEADREKKVEQVTQITVENPPQSIEEDEKTSGQLEEAEVIELPEMEWALLLETEVSHGVAAGNFYWRYGIYGDFTDSQKAGEKIYFSLNESILGKRLELASTLNREETEENYENNHHRAWYKSKEEHIVGVSPDLEWIITWQMGEGEGKERWYKNKEMVYEHDIKDTGYGRKGFIPQKTQEGVLPIEEHKIIKAEEMLRELYGLMKFYSLDYRTIYCFSSNGRVFAAANRTEWKEPDAINIYSLIGEEPVLAHELSIPTDEMEWPIQIWQVEGDEYSGWVVFSYGCETFQITYPAGNIEKLGEYMFAVSYSPDKKYLAYCPGNEIMWYSWMSSMGADVEEEMFLEQCYLIQEQMKKIPQGWYVMDSETGEKSYIPVPLWEYEADRLLYGGQCTWVEKDKLMELLERK